MCKITTQKNKTKNLVVCILVLHDIAVIINLCCSVKQLDTYVGDNTFSCIQYSYMDVLDNCSTK